MTSNVVRWHHYMLQLAVKKNPNISIFGTCKYYQNAQL